MADYTVTTDIDNFMQSADKAAMRTNMDLGTAATKDVAATGDAAAGEVVKGDDTRLADARTPTSHTHTASEVTDFDTEVANNTTVAANTSKLAGIEAGAEVNNISDVNATDLTDGGDSTLHYHSADRARANHTGTQTLSTISDAGTAASKDVPATGDAGAGQVVLGNDSRLTDARTPTAHTHTASEITDFDTEVANNTTVAANTSKLAGIEAGAEVNNISDVNATDLTDGGDSSLHYHSADRNRSNHTGTQTLSTISDAGTIASQNANSVNITGGSVTGITDLAIADGGTGAGTAAGARTNLDVYSTGEVDEYLGPKATAGGVAFDGAVGYAVLGVDVSSLFSSPFSFTWTYKPLSSPSSGTRIFQFGTSNNSNLNTASSTQFELFLNTDGTDGRYRWPYPTDYTKYYTFTLVIDPSDITSPVLYRDGVLQTRTTQNTPTGNVLVPSGDITCFGPVVFDNAQIRNLAIFNRALTSTEVADLYRNGLAGIADVDRWGSNNIVKAQNSTFDAAGVGDWGSLFGGATIANNANALDLTFAASGVSGTRLPAAGYSDITNYQIKCRIKFDIESLGVDTAMRVGFGGQPEEKIFTATSTVQTITHEFIFTNVANIATGGGLTFYTVSSNGVTVRIDNISVEWVGAIAAYPMDEGIGYQLHDISSNHYDGLLSTSGFTHLVPKTEGKVRVKAADASSAMYMLRAGDIIPTNSIVDNVLSEQCFVDLTNSAQTLDDYRVRLNPSLIDLQIQRSDGSNHQTLGTVTAPSSLSDVDVEIQYTQVAR